MIQQFRVHISSRSQTQWGLYYKNSVLKKEVQNQNNLQNPRQQIKQADMTDRFEHLTSSIMAQTKTIFSEERNLQKHNLCIHGSRTAVSLCLHSWQVLRGLQGCLTYCEAMQAITCSTRSFSPSNHEYVYTEAHFSVRNRHSKMQFSATKLLSSALLP